MPALLFGSISSLADTSEIQRESFNQAFTEHGLDWRWDREDYQALLAGNGGRQRIADAAAERGEDVDAEAVHATKSQLFQQRLRESGVTLRPGIPETIASAKRQGTKLALVTTTSPENVSALLDAVPDLTADDFDLVLDATHVRAGKPDPAAYALALERLGEAPEDCLAVEDNVGGLTAALAAGVRCVAFPNANTADHEFPGAELRTDRIDHDLLTRLVAAR